MTTYVCADPKCRGRRHRRESLIGRAHWTYTILAARAAFTRAAA